MKNNTVEEIVFELTKDLHHDFIKGSDVPSFIKEILTDALTTLTQHHQDELREGFKSLCIVNNDGDCKYFKDDIHEKLLRGGKFVAQEILEALTRAIDISDKN